MENFSAILIILGLILFVVFAPLLAIWAINTLLSLSIAFTFKTWLATWVLAFFFGGSGTLLTIKSK